MTRQFKAINEVLKAFETLDSDIRYIYIDRENKDWGLLHKGDKFQA